MFRQSRITVSLTSTFSLTEQQFPIVRSYYGVIAKSFVIQMSAYFKCITTSQTNPSKGDYKCLKKTTILANSPQRPINLGMRQMHSAVHTCRDIPGTLHGIQTRAD